ncbi:MAG: alpha-L-fucosidase [Bacteroidota bacterium]|nr:alpha-L-fucosidase [Bacteroidota bacterium]
MANAALGQDANEPIATGIFEPTWKSLEQYKVPDWFRNAKFGIWAHWGPQCQPEQGDWYARFMYAEGSREYKWSTENYGHPSEYGFKDVCNAWKAEKWDPETLVKLYKKAGARYFFAMANHHDNFDLWDSKYQPWNSAKIGPKKDIIDGWAKAARHNGLYFGASIHAAHAWRFYETAQGSDKTGAKAGIPYDGNLTKADGKGKWWEGLDPQDLYVQNHRLSDDSENLGSIHRQWNWDNGVTVPSVKYCNNFYDRTVDLVNKYNPDLLYFDDTALPLWPISDAGLRIAAHFYNHNMKTHNGKQEGVIFGKILTPDQKKCILWDVERGAPDKIQEIPWQTCTCIGEWHYRRSVYDENRYKTAKTVIQMLADIVSKNGNLLLNIPVRGNGTIDEKELKVVEEIGAWMAVNSDGIYDTRPWKIFGEGPSADGSNPINAQGFNEGKTEYSAKDIRFTTKKGILYAIVLGWPEDGKIMIKSLSDNNPLHPDKVNKVEMLGNGNLKFATGTEGLTVTLPAKKTSDIGFVLKIK